MKRRRAEKDRNFEHHEVRTRLVMISLFKYFVASGITFALNIGITFSLTEILKIRPELSYGIALLIVSITSFMLLRYYVYGATDKNIVLQFASYCASALGFRGMEYLSFLLVYYLSGLKYGIVVILIQSISALTKFFYYRGLVFKEKQRS
ncbi:MAG: GtrA family protein [Deltaproteobacteria bacterium]|nr:GtrA family protein [Deltaproteobacteria bacterium]MBW1995769.1 GtrA family protein [Deltaproteobacteria bacterium]